MNTGEYVRQDEAQYILVVSGRKFSEGVKNSNKNVVYFICTEYFFIAEKRKSFILLNLVQCKKIYPAFIWNVVFYLHNVGKLSNPCWLLPETKSAVARFQWVAMNG
jgi:hypothetical protein